MSEKLSAEGLKAAADMTKQIITLSTGVLAITITFLEKIVHAPSPPVPRSLLAAWVLFGLAILFAIVTLAAVTGTLDALDRRMNGLPTTGDQNAAIDALCTGWNIRAPALAMCASFFLAMSFTIVTGLTH